MEMGRNSAKTRISGSTLFSLLTNEFSKRKPRGCETCFIPMPFRVDDAEITGTNWALGNAAPCPHHCITVIDGLVRELSLIYDLEEE